MGKIEVHALFFHFVYYKERKKAKRERRKWKREEGKEEKTKDRQN